MNGSIDGGRCLERLKEIWENDRFGDFSHFQKTSGVVARLLEEAGCEQIERLHLRADGKTRYGDWTMPRAWDVNNAALRLVLPDGAMETLCDASKTPLCVMMFSAPVACGWFQAVWAEKTDAANWRGRILYTENAPKALVRKALEHGAVGVISDWFPVYPGVREADDPMGGAFRWENDLFYPENQTNLFGFTLSRCTGQRLRALFENSADVTLEAEIDAVCYDGVSEVVSGLIPGEGTDEEIMLCGHLYEPGANDNASGCALLLSVAEALRQAFPQRRRGVRLVMGYEAAGMSGYVCAHRDRMSRTIAALNCDMVGAALCERAVLKIWNSPLSTGDFTFPFLKELAARQGIAFEPSAFDIGDGLVADPSIGVPCCSLVMHPAVSYHSSLDTPERVDPRMLERCGAIALMWAGTLAAPGEQDVSLIRTLLEKEYAQLCARSQERSFPLRVQAYERAYEAFERWAYEEPVPRRLFCGPATLNGQMRMSCPELDPFYNIQYNTALFHVDGRRTLRSVIRRTCMELDLDMTQETQARFRRFFDAMQRAGLIELERT